MRVVFMGSPQFALPSLEALFENYEVVGVVTQPDRPAGRGRSLRQSVVKTFALQNELAIEQPAKIKTPEAIESICAWKPEVIVVAAFGQIIPSTILDFPEYGSLNVHASLLPRWRGAAPIQAAIINGDRMTGVTIMRMDAGLDTGPTLSQRNTSIKLNETGGELTSRLAKLGAELLIDTLPLYFDGSLVPEPQKTSDATYAPMLKKSDGALDFTKSASYLARQVRAYEPWPGSFITWGDDRIAIRDVRALPLPRASPGLVMEKEGYPVIGTSDGFLVLEIVHPSGRKPMSGDAFLRGAKGFVGERL